MSTQILTIIPTDPFFAPSPEAAAKAVSLIRNVFAEVDDAADVTVEWKTSDAPTFVSSMESFETVHCPKCDAELEIEWWQDRMDADFDGEAFSTLTTFTTPCCGTSANLNDLRYEAPQGFARFEISCQEPPVVELSTEHIDRIEKVVGCALRQIVAHV